MWTDGKHFLFVDIILLEPNLKMETKADTVELTYRIATRIRSLTSSVYN